MGLIKAKMSDNTAQKTKKNKSRVKVQDRAFYPSIQRNYKKITPQNNAQTKLF